MSSEGHVEGGTTSTAGGPSEVEVEEEFVAWMLHRYKVFPCASDACPYDASECFFSHIPRTLDGVPERRQLSRLKDGSWNYTTAQCPYAFGSGRIRECPAANSCNMAHYPLEILYHPLQYRTKMCPTGDGCALICCPSAHCREQLRQATSEDWLSWDETKLKFRRVTPLPQKWIVFQEKLKAAKSASALVSIGSSVEDSSSGDEDEDFKLSESMLITAGESVEVSTEVVIDSMEDGSHADDGSHVADGRHVDDGRQAVVVDTEVVDSDADASGEEEEVDECCGSISKEKKKVFEDKEVVRSRIVAEMLANAEAMGGADLVAKAKHALKSLIPPSVSDKAEDGLDYAQVADTRGSDDFHKSDVIYSLEHSKASTRRKSDVPLADGFVGGGRMLPKWRVKRAGTCGVLKTDPFDDIRPRLEIDANTVELYGLPSFVDKTLLRSALFARTSTIMGDLLRDGEVVIDGLFRTCTLHFRHHAYTDAILESGLIVAGSHVRARKPGHVSVPSVADGRGPDSRLLLDAERRRKKTEEQLTEELPLPIPSAPPFVELADASDDKDKKASVIVSTDDSHAVDCIETELSLASAPPLVEVADASHGKDALPVTVATGDSHAVAAMEEVKRDGHCESETECESSEEKKCDECESENEEDAVGSKDVDYRWPLGYPYFLPEEYSGLCETERLKRAEEFAFDCDPKVVSSPMAALFKRRVLVCDTRAPVYVMRGGVVHEFDLEQKRFRSEATGVEKTFERKKRKNHRKRAKHAVAEAVDASESAVKGSADGTWKCPHCTFRNMAVATHCGACFQKRDSVLRWF